MNRMKIERIGALMILLPCAGCFSGRPRDHLIVVRQPWQMIDPAPKRSPVPVASQAPAVAKVKEPRDKIVASPRRPLTPPEAPEHAATPAEVIEDARRGATQEPSAEGFVDAVQIYDYEPGAIYEVITTPGFVTVLRLRLGEQILHLAAGDTSRWLIDTISSGVVDPQATLTDTLSVGTPRTQASRLSILIKPRRPLIQTNLVIATNQRTYLIDLKSVDATAYHSVVEWTYPQAPTNKLSAVRPNASRPTDDGTRNYAYLIKVPPGGVPRWTPVSVFDDGHRVHVEFPKGIDDLRRPPLFIVGDDGAVRLVNYHIDKRAYVVHELFDRAELRLGRDRVVIDRIKPKPHHPIARLFHALGGTE